MNEQNSEEHLNSAPMNERMEGEESDRTERSYPLTGDTLGGEERAHERQRDETVMREGASGPNGGSSVPLLGRDVAEDFRMRWHEIQGKFVDDPRSAVQQADGLVAETIEQIEQVFSKERGTLESQWKQSNDVSTEDLRQALQHYRSFFNRLVG